MAQTKAANRTLKSNLCCLSSDQPRKWVLALPQADFANNNMHNRSATKCPFELVYRHPPRSTFDLTNLPTDVDHSAKPIL